MKARFDASGCVLVVTGGAHGIGRAIGEAYAAAGGTSYLLDIAPCTDLPANVHALPCDVSDRSAVLAAIGTVSDAHGRIDGLVAGAAIQPRIAVADISEDTWRSVLDVNLNGVVWAVQAVLPVMQSRRTGSIVMFGSGLGTNGRAQAAAYAASKGALVSLAKSVAAEVIADRIRVNLLYPGVIDTAQFRAANQGPEREFWEQTIGVGTAGDVVGPAMFLLSGAATMTGSILSRDRAFSGDDDD